METKIDDILENYNISAPERTIKRVTCKVINEAYNTALDPADVRYQHGTLWIDTAPMVRSQIHMNKQEITQKISEQIENRTISDIN
jgi:hypothetical protein